MKYSINKVGKFTIIFTCLIFCAALFKSHAQKVPISFNDFHGYTGSVNYIKKVAKAYPKITDLLEIGKTNMGRPIYVLVISNQNNGTTIDAEVKLRNMRKEGVKNVIPMKSYQGKPAQWIDGSIHGNEYTANEVCLYIIDKLVSGYSSDPEIKQLIDTKAIYICPVSNPDGVYNSVEMGISQRQNSMKNDDDGDGKINEDGPDDLNGDGYITQFRYKDPEGSYVIDEEDSRLMLRFNQGQETDKQRYSVITEDKDNDGDGKRGEDSERGIDLNRNFPEGWFKDDGFRGGTGDYPTSSPETHAIAEFFTNHRNILMAQNFHTSGGFTFRPPGTSSEKSMHAKDVAVYDLVMGKKYLEIIGLDLPKAWQYPDSISKYKAELKNSSKNNYAIDRGYVMPDGWINSYNEDRDSRYGYGMIIDWMYQQYGAFSTTTELWDPVKNIEGFPKFEGRDARTKQSRELLKYQDENYDGKFFISWKSFKHPELGDGEIGGWIPKYSGRGNAFPGKPLLDVCEKHWKFELFRAKLLPEVVITEAITNVLYSTNNANEVTVKQEGDQVKIKKEKSKGKYKIIEITVKIENQGELATHLARGARLSGNRDDAVWLIGDPDKITFLQGSAFQKVGVMDGQMKIPGYKSSGSTRQGTRAPNIPQGYPQQRMGMRGQTQSIAQTGTKREIKWLVAVEDNTPLKVVVTSQKGGTKVKKLSY
ncbi:M14 family metallopeptidase [Bacteroidota bacterium]